MIHLKSHLFTGANRHYRGGVHCHVDPQGTRAFRNPQSGTRDWEWLEAKTACGPRRVLIY